MDDLLKSITEYSAWPMVHVFIPSIIAIYNKNIFVLISIIYLFESAEFFFAILTGLEYWSDIGANALISDIIMGLTGFWLIQIIGETEYKHEKIPWYAVLKYREGYWKWYEIISTLFTRFTRIRVRCTNVNINYYGNIAGKYAP